MATMNKFPPDVPKSWDEAQDEIENATDGLRSKAANVAEKATDTIKDGYQRAKEAITEMDPVETARESGEVVLRTIERNPVAAFGLGALSVGLIAWAALRRPEPTYGADFGSLRRLFSDYGGDDAIKAGQSAMKNGESWLNSSSGYARDYARDGGRYLAKRTEKEPIAALLGVGIAVYVLGSLLTSSGETPAPRKRVTRR